MIFGRSTVIIMAAILATMQLAKQAILVVFPGLDPVAIGTLLELLTAAIAAWIAVLAWTSTTPTHDPRLKDNTMVQITDESGVVIDHKPILAEKAPDRPEA